MVKQDNVSADRKKSQRISGGWINNGRSEGENREMKRRTWLGISEQGMGTEAEGNWEEDSRLDAATPPLVLCALLANTQIMR